MSKSGDRSANFHFCEFSVCGIFAATFSRFVTILKNVQLTLKQGEHEIVIVQESPTVPRFDPKSADNVGDAEKEYFLGDRGYAPASRERIMVKQGGKEIASRILLATGGATGVHTHSAFVRGKRCFVAVGPFVCALEVPTLRLLWHAKVDSATCLGIFDAPKYQSIISHGELEIARLTYAGAVLWSRSGRDIFSEGFTLFDDYAEAIDFYGAVYRFELETGWLRE